MSKALLLYLLLATTISKVAYGQIDAVVEDDLMDRYYINYPMVADSKWYEVGDTVASVYNSINQKWDKNRCFAFHYIPKSAAQPVYVARAIVTEVRSGVGLKSHIVFGLKLRIYSIERHDENRVILVDEYTTPYTHCLLKRGNEQWRDIADWQNITGLYRIRKSTDNYHIGDTVHRIYRRDKSLVGRLFGTGLNKTYELTAVVKDIDTSHAQNLLLQFTEMKLSYYKLNAFFPNRSHNVTLYEDSMQYNFETVHKNSPVWTKPYLWLLPWQSAQVTDGRGIPSSVVFYRYCNNRIVMYDCDGNEYDLSGEAVRR